MKKLIYILLLILSFTVYSQDKDYGWAKRSYKIEYDDTVKFNKPFILQSGDTCTMFVLNDSICMKCNSLDTVRIDGNVSIGGGSYTDEQAQDAVGNILTDGTTIDFTYNDGTPIITAEVINSSVSYSKIQNVSATDRLLGRETAGAGVVEEITCTSAGRALLDDADASTQRSTLDVDQAGTDNSTDVTLNASATTGGLSISTQEISFRAATNAQTGYATASHITAIEANTAKETNATHTGDVTGSGELTISSDAVDDTHINWGTGANQVSTTDIPEGTNLYYTEVRVSANTDVSANTSARHSAVTVSGTPDYITLSEQDIVRGQIDLTSDVTGNLPYSSLSSTPDIEDTITLNEHDSITAESFIQTWDSLAHTTPQNINFHGGDYKYIYIEGIETINITGLPSGESILYIEQDGSGYAITKGTGWGDLMGTGTISSTADAETIIQFMKVELPGGSTKIRHFIISD